MGKSSKKAAGTLGGAASGAALGTSIAPGYGTAIGALGGAVLGSMETDGGDPQQVQQVDPAFMNSLYNQAMGTEKTAADMKMKAAFDQTLAQQVAAARAARGVNPALLSRNVARAGQEANAKAAQLGAEMNLKNQEDARTKYLTALGMNQNAQLANSKMDMAAEERDSKRTGSMLNSIGAIGSTFATAQAAKDQADASKPSDNAVKGSYSNQNLSVSGNPGPAMPDYSLGANANITVPQYSLDATSDKAAKKSIKSEMTVMSDERQKDLIKSESLPANGNMGVQNQQAMQPQAPQAPMQTPMMAAQTAPTSATPQQVPQAPAAAPAPVPASQTAMGQANASLAKGGRIDDLSMKDTSQLVKPADGPSAAEILHFSTEAQRQQQRDMFGNVTRSDKDIYNQFINEWQQNNHAQKADYMQQLADSKIANAGINNERAARLSKFYTGTTAVNANDIAQRYAPKTTTGGVMGWQAAQEAQRAAGIGDQSRGTNLVPGATLLAGTNVLSDERAKDQIKSEGAAAPKDDMNPKSFLDALTAYSYEYKDKQKNNPKAGDGRYLSVMAQDLEKAGPVGKSMVQENPQGVKEISYGKGFGAILAAQVTLNERLSKLESKKGK